MDQVPGSTIGTHAIKYSVNYLKGVDKVAPLPDLPYQIVPLKDPTKLNVGDYLPVQVLHNGQPLPNGSYLNYFLGFGGSHCAWVLDWQG